MLRRVWCSSRKTFPATRTRGVVVKDSCFGFFETQGNISREVSLRSSHVWHRSLSILAVTTDAEGLRFESKVFAALLGVLLGTSASLSLSSADASDISQRERTRSIEEESDPEKRIELLRAFTKWLEERGAVLSGISLQECTEEASAGMGVYCNDLRSICAPGPKWWAPWRYLSPPPKPQIIALFPLSSCLTSRSVLSHPHKPLAELYKGLLANGTVDDTSMVMLHLMVERARGADSEIQRYISMLPASFTTPIFYTDRELAELLGTNLFQATRMKQQHLQEHFEHVRPAANALWRTAGLEGEPSLVDFAWAYSIFWSRALLIPDTEMEEEEEEPVNEEVGEGGEVFRPMITALIPGLDFCNHSNGNSVDVLDAVWTIFGNPELTKGESGVDGNPESVALIAKHTDAARCIKHNKDKRPVEVRINYGDKGNEELLFLYGFSIRDNPNETFMLHFPLDKTNQDESVVKERIRILMESGLGPQHFLVMSDLINYKTKSKGRWSWRKSDQSADAYLGPFPMEIIRTLEVLAMTDEEVMALSSQHGESNAEDQQGSKTAVQASGSIDEVSLRTRALSNLVGLLDRKLRELETATGPIAQDIALLKKDQSYNNRACVQYRLSQKELLNGFLEAATELLEKQG